MLSENSLTNTPLVSILMTAYNRKEFIKEAMESVIASTYINFELIVVDDCSTDNTLAIANEIALRDKRVFIHKNEKNLGDYPNRNKAASYARGKYLKYVDSDDKIHSDSLTYMVEVMENHPTAGFGFSTANNDTPQILPKFYTGREALRHHFLEAGLLQAGPSTTIIRRDAFETLGGFPEQRFVSDYEAWLYLSLNNDLVVFRKNLVWVRMHSQQENEVGKLAYYSLNYNLHKMFLKNVQNIFTHEEKKKLLYNYKILLARRVYQRLLKWFGLKKTMGVIHAAGESYSLFFWALLPMKKLNNRRDK